MSVDIDEARDDEPAGSIDLPPSFDPGADLADPAVANADIGPQAGAAGPVDHRSSPNGKIVLHRISPHPKTALYARFEPVAQAVILSVGFEKPGEATMSAGSDGQLKRISYA